MAINNATMLWPEHSNLYVADSRNLLLQHEVFSDMNPANLPDARALARIPKINPMSRAFAASVAQIAGTQ